MGTSQEQRMLKNEAFLREQNEKLQRDIDHVKALAEEEHEAVTLPSEDMPLHFYCECADENCLQRIKMTLSEYNKLHKDRCCFTIACGHNVPKIEKVIDKKPSYWVVKKHTDPPESVDSLQPTPIDNT